MALVYIGLGSNLVTPVLQLETALEAIAKLPQTKLLKCSPFYGSTPLGPLDQPDFVNAVCLIETALPPADLLSALQDIELTQGRIKERHWGERLIDLDILLYDQDVIQTESLIVPHKEIAFRDFVLIPLAALSPGLVIPGLGQVENLISQLDTTYLKSLDS